jgi:hypothetical protein
VNNKQRIIFWLCMAGLLLLTLLMTKEEVTMAGNESSRFALIQALAEQDTFAVNNTMFRSVDRVIRDGKVYSDKPPMLMVGFGMVYKGIAAITGISFKDNYYLSVYLVNLLLGLLNIGMVYIFFRYLSRDSSAPFASRLIFSMALLLSTLLFSFGVSMNNHTPAAFLLLLFFLLLRDYSTKQSWMLSLSLGLIAGTIFNLEIPVGGLFGVAGGLIVLITPAKQRLYRAAVFSAGAIIPVAVITVINYLAYHQWLPLYIGGTFTPGVDNKNYLVYFLDILFCGRGFFSYMPALLFIVPAVYLGRKKWCRVHDVILLAAVAAVILFYGICTNEYGGWAYGFRYLIPLIPVLWYYIALEFAHRIFTPGYYLLMFLILWGVVVSMVGAYNPWCSCYEAHRSQPNTVDYNIRNTFAANLLCISFSRDENSALSQFLIKHIYGETLAIYYLHEAYSNTKDIANLKKLQQFAAAKQQQRKMAEPKK